jgi:Tol biopolymer transport system component
LKERKMPDVQEVFNLATQKVRPDPNALERQRKRQRGAARARKVSAFAAVAAVLVVAAAAFVALRTVDDRVPTPGDATPTFTTTPGTNVQTTEVIGLDGATRQVLTGYPEDAWGLSLSADGTKVAFAMEPADLAINQVATMSVDGTGLKILTTDGVDAGVTSLSPDGARIAFEGTTELNTDIYVMNADGSGLQRLTIDAGVDQFPTWSPDGSTIAYDNSGSKTDVTDPQFSSTAEIWSVPADGGTPTRLTHDSIVDNAPSYSPDGKDIAYFHNGAVWAMGADGSNPHQIVRRPAPAPGHAHGSFTPRWSPDGTMIAFTIYQDPNPRPTIVRNGVIQDNTPFLTLGIAVLGTNNQIHLDQVGMSTDFNLPQWLPGSDGLVIRRVGDLG